jgi:hypothetical protein
MMDGTMMNKNTPAAVSSITQHPYVYDGKAKFLEPVASMGAVMNQQTNILFPVFTTLSIASGWEMSESAQSLSLPSAYVPSPSASFLRRDTVISFESPSFVTNTDSNIANDASLSSKIPNFYFHHGSNITPALSSMTAKGYRKVPYTIIPFEKKDI